MPPRASKKKKRLWLRALRWALAIAALAVTWFYGAWKGGNALWIAFPAGIVVMLCTAAALAIPVVTAALVAVAFIYGIDGGLVSALRNAAAAVIVIGLALSGWNVATRFAARGRHR